MAEMSSKSCPDIAEISSTLTAADHLGVYAQLRDSVFSILRSSQDMSSEDPCLQKLTRSFAPVISAGLRLVGQQIADDQQQATLETADSLYCCVEAYGNGLHALRGDSEGKDRALYDVASAGLLQAMASAAGTLRSLTIINHEGRTPASINSKPSGQASEVPAAVKQGPDPSKAAAAAAAVDPLVCFSKSLYRLFGLLVHIWPHDQVLSSQGLPETIWSMADLAEEQLRYFAAEGGTTAVDAAATTAPEESSSSSNKGSPPCPVQRHPFVDSVAHFVDIVSMVAHNEVARPRHLLQPAIARRLMQSDCLRYLICWQLAKAAQRLHFKSVGAVSASLAVGASAACSVSASSSNRNQQPPSAHHMQLYSALNMLAPAQVSSPERSISGIIVLLTTLIRHRLEYTTSLSVGSRSMHSRIQPGLEVTQVLHPAVVAPLFLTAVELLTLSPPSAGMSADCKALITVLATVLQDQKGIIPPAQSEEAYLSLLRPILFELLPYARQCMDIQASAVTKPSPQEVHRHFAAILGVVISASETADTDKLARGLAAVFSEQPVSTVAEYEAALRFTAGREEFSTTVTRANIGIILNTVLGHQDHGSVTASGSSLAAAVAADPCHLGQHLWSLLMSDLKGVLIMARSDQNDVSAALQIAAAAIAVGANDEVVLEYFQIEQSDSRVVQVVSQISAQQQHQQQQQGRGAPGAAAAAAAAGASNVAGAAPQQLWLVLVGRSLYVLGEAVKQMFNLASSTPELQPALAPLVPVALAAVHWMGKQLPQLKLSPESAAAAQAMQELLEKQQVLQAELQQEVDKMETVARVLGHESEDAREGSAAMCLCAAANGIRNFGAALCTELPVTCCCANPCCVNMSESSELLLASKGSRCSGCRVVRYCGVECQRQHWKLHKHVCARYKADKAK